MTCTITTKKAKDKTLIGQLATLLAEPFGINDERTIQDVAIAAGYMNTFTHLLDDATDMRSENAPALMHAATTDLLEGIRETLKLEKNPQEVYHKIIQYWEEASEGERHLWRHHKNVFPYDKKDFEMLGHRGAIGKVPIALFADFSRRNEVVAPLEEGVKNAAIAIQLFDDVFDWKGDLKEKIYTHPIALAYQHSGNLDERAIETGLFYTPAAREVLQIAYQYFEVSKQLFSSSGATSFTRLVGTLQESTKKMQEHLVSEQKVLSPHRDITTILKSVANPLLTQH